jgi:protein-tyrosine phosphatase
MLMEWYDALPVSKIYNRLFLSGYHAASLLNKDNPFGIDFVLDVSTEPPYEEAKGIEYCHIPFNDGAEIPEKKFWECMQVLFDRYQRGKNILIHCAAGISRSATIAAAFLHFAHIMQFADALAYITQRRAVVEPKEETLASVRKLLKVWPYDGSMETS